MPRTYNKRRIHNTGDTAPPDPKRLKRDTDRTSRLSPTTVHSALRELLKDAESHERRRAKRAAQTGKSVADIADDELYVYLVVTLKQPPFKPRLRPYSIPLKHSIYTSGEDDICFFVKDPQRQIKDYLAEHGNGEVTCIMGVDKLRKRYKTHEGRRELLDMYDLFLVDNRVAPMMPTLLGSAFIQAKKMPLTVDVRRDVVEGIRRAIRSTAYAPAQGTCSTVKVGKVEFGLDKLVENVCMAMDGVVDKIEGGWHDVQSVNLKTNMSPALPIYLTMPTALEVVGKAVNGVTGEVKEGESGSTKKRSAKDVTGVENGIRKSRRKRTKKKRGNHANKDEKERVTYDVGGEEWGMVKGTTNKDDSTADPDDSNEVIKTEATGESKKKKVSKKNDTSGSEKRKVQKKIVKKGAEVEKEENRDEDKAIKEQTGSGSLIEKTETDGQGMDKGENGRGEGNEEAVVGRRKSKRGSVKKKEAKPGSEEGSKKTKVFKAESEAGGIKKKGVKGGIEGGATKEKGIKSGSEEGSSKKKGIKAGSEEGSKKTKVFKAESEAGSIKKKGVKGGSEGGATKEKGIKSGSEEGSSKKKGIKAGSQEGGIKKKVTKTAVEYGGIKKGTKAASEEGIIKKKGSKAGSGDGEEGSIKKKGIKGGSEENRTKKNMVKVGSEKMMNVLSEKNRTAERIEGKEMRAKLRKRRTDEVDEGGRGVVVVEKKTDERDEGCEVGVVEKKVKKAQRRRSRLGMK